jgi:hypothetical protein
MSARPHGTEGEIQQDLIEGTRAKEFDQIEVGGHIR